MRYGCRSVRIVSAAAVIATVSLFVCSCGVLSQKRARSQDEVLRVLIISGRNNHLWQKTTPELKKMYEESGRFAVDVTHEPGKCDRKMLSKYDVIVSNWSAWPELTGHQWPQETKTAVEQFVGEGKGLVVFHAASATFHDWPQYQQMVGATWDVEKTGHGPIRPLKVLIRDKRHPITNGMEDFVITDELWHRMATQPGIRVLCEAFSVQDKMRDGIRHGTEKPEPVAVCTEFGNGRCFNNILGHDVAAMRNSGWRTLMLRGTEWAATGKVTIAAQAAGVEKTNYRWRNGDNWIALLNNDRVVWRMNYNKQEGKPYVHPVSMTDGTELTWLRPADHPWHRGLWFSWKFINGVNYWEEDKYGVSAGLTELMQVKVLAHEEHWARIEMLLEYHRLTEAPVLRERRIIEVSRPDEEGMYYFDWCGTFTACDANVVLDRTPIAGERDGRSWGGYAGLGVRLSSLLYDWEVVNSDGQRDLQGHGRKAGWVDFSGKIGGGKTAGVAVFDHPENLRHPSPWHIVFSQPVFGFFNPSVLFNGPYTLCGGESLRLRYRVLVHPGPADKERLDAEWNKFADKTPSRTTWQ